MQTLEQICQLSILGFAQRTGQHLQSDDIVDGNAVDTKESPNGL